MKKRWVSLLLTGALIGTLGTGCGKATDKVDTSKFATITDEKSASDKVALTVWGSKDDEEMYNKMFDGFKEKYKGEAKMEITYTPVEEADCKNTVVEDVKACADVFSFADDQLSTFAAAGICKPIANADKVKADDLEGAIEAATINDEIYAYPATADNGYFMYYNKKYFSDSDLGSLDTMMQIAKKNNAAITMDWSGWYAYSFFANTGLELGLNQDGITNYCTWNSKKGDIKGVDVAEAMVSIKKNPGFKAGNDDDLLKGAKNGTVIAGISGVWMANSLKEAWGDDLGATALPTYTCAGKQVQMGSYSGYKLLGVNSYSANREWAEKLAEWMTNEENQTLRFQMRANGPANKKASESEDVKNNVAIKGLLAQSQYASLQRVGGKYWDPVLNFCQDILSGKYDNGGDMQHVLDKLVENITAIS